MAKCTISPLRQRMIDDMTLRKLSDQKPNSATSALLRGLLSSYSEAQIPRALKTFDCSRCISWSKGSPVKPSTPRSPACAFSLRSLSIDHEPCDT